MVQEKGRIIEILTQKENDWGRYKLDDTGREILAVGVIPKAQLGMYVEVEGALENKGYGEQFSIKKVISAERDKFAGIRGYLASGMVKGIGPAIASRIVDMYGADTEKAFEENNGEALLKVKGISKNKLRPILASYEETQDEKTVMVLLNGSATKAQVAKILEQYGHKVKTVLKKNPYRLMYDMKGFGFLKTDAIALASGVKQDSVYRIAAAVIYALDQAAKLNGHCYLSMDELRDNVVDLLVKYPKGDKITDVIIKNSINKWNEKRENFIQKYDPDGDLLEQMDRCSGTVENIKDSLFDAMCQSIEDGLIVNDDGNIYTQKMFETEVESARILAEMIEQKPVFFVKPENVEKSIKEVEARKTEQLHKEGKDFDFVFMKEQKDAVYMAAMHRVSIISGGPGRGKTAISEAVAASFLKSCPRFGRYDSDNVIMLAPTGRAAQRMTESTGYPAMTVHRFIMQNSKFKNKNFDEPVGYVKSDFDDDSENEIKNKLIICDESSMVDVCLLRRLLEKARYCNLVFVGDIDQIASVGPGRVLADLIASGKVPYAILKESHRNEGAIEHNSRLINAGESIRTYCYDDSFRYYPSAKENIRDVIVNDYIECVNKYGIKNVMLLLAMKRGVLSVTDINNYLQSICTKGDYIQFGSSKFRVGDRVMQTRNNYDFTMLDANGNYRQGVFNGEKGSVYEICNKDGVKYLKVFFDDGSKGCYTENTAQQLILAYATTVHKSQGSEADCVLMGYTYGDYILLNRNLFYTGETRAKKEFRFYGEEKVNRGGYLMSAFDLAVNRVDDSKRNTMLAQRISDELVKKAFA